MERSADIVGGQISNIANLICGSHKIRDEATVTVFAIMENEVILRRQNFTFMLITATICLISIIYI